MRLLAQMATTAAPQAQEQHRSTTTAMIGTTGKPDSGDGSCLVGGSNSGNAAGVGVAKKIHNVKVPVAMLLDFARLDTGSICREGIRARRK